MEFFSKKEERKENKEKLEKLEKSGVNFEVHTFTHTQ